MKPRRGDGLVVPPPAGSSTIYRQVCALDLPGRQACKSKLRYADQHRGEVLHLIML
jgi:hypothetical protein